MSRSERALRVRQLPPLRQLPPRPFLDLLCDHFLWENQWPRARAARPAAYTHTPKRVCTAPTTRHALACRSVALERVQNIPQQHDALDVTGSERIRVIAFVESCAICPGRVFLPTSRLRCYAAAAASAKRMLQMTTVKGPAPAPSLVRSCA